MNAGRRSFVTVFAVLVAMLPAATSAAAGPRAATANRPSTTLLTSSTLRLQSSTGRHLYLSVDVDRFSYRPQPSNPVTTTVNIEVSNNATEDHSWDFEVPNTVFHYGRHTGRGSFEATSAELHSFGQVSLKIQKRGTPAVHDCANGESFTRQPVTLTGHLSFRTRSAAWGRLGGQSPLTFKGHSEVETDHGNLEKLCGGPRLPRCAGNVGWESPGSTHGGFSGESTTRRGHEREVLEFETGESLKSTNYEVNRDDFVITEGARPPAFTSLPDGTKQVKVHAGTHGDITGSATLVSAGAPTTAHGSCRGGDTRSWRASFTNGKDPLTVHMDIGGTFSPRNAATGAEFSRDSH
jgi:hypothetical protein